MGFLFGDSTQTASEANAQDERKKLLAAHPPALGAGGADAASPVSAFMGASPARLQAASPSAQPSEFDMSPADLKRSEDMSSGEHPAGSVGAEPKSKPSVTERAKGILGKAKPAAPDSTGDDIQSPVMIDDSHPMPPQPQEAPKHDYELDEAMRQSALRHRIGSVFQLFGVNPAGMDKPLEDLERQRADERAHFQDTVMQDQYDPSSRPSKLLQAIAVKKYHWSLEDAQGLTASDQKLVEAGYNADQVREARKDMMREKKYEADAREREAGQRDLTERRGQDLRYKAEMARAGQEKATPPTVSGHFAALDTADAILDQMPEVHGPADLGKFIQWQNDMIPKLGSLSTRLGKPLMDRLSEALPNKKNATIGEMTGLMPSLTQAQARARAEIAAERQALIDSEQDAKRDPSRFAARAAGHEAARGQTVVKNGKTYVKTPQGWVEQ